MHSTHISWALLHAGLSAKWWGLNLNKADQSKLPVPQRGFQRERDGQLNKNPTQYSKCRRRKEGNHGDVNLEASVGIIGQYSESRADQVWRLNAGEACPSPQPIQSSAFKRHVPFSDGALARGKSTTAGIVKRKRQGFLSLAQRPCWCPAHGTYRLRLRWRLEGCLSHHPPPAFPIGLPLPPMQPAWPLPQPLQGIQWDGNQGLCHTGNLQNSPPTGSP